MYSRQYFHNDSPSPDTDLQWGPGGLLRIAALSRTTGLQSRSWCRQSLFIRVPDLFLTAYAMNVEHCRLIPLWIFSKVDEFSETAISSARTRPILSATIQPVVAPNRLAS